MKYFGYYDEFGYEFLIEFQTKEQRDTWVDYRDDPMITKESSPFSRMALEDYAVDFILQNKDTYTLTTDADQPYMTYYESCLSQYLYS